MKRKMFFTIELKLNNINESELSPAIINSMFGYDYYQVLEQYTEYEIIYVIELTNNILSGGGTKTYTVLEVDN